MNKQPNRPGWYRVVITMPPAPGKRKCWRHEFIALGENRDEAIHNAREAYPAYFDNIDGTHIDTEALDFDRAVKLRTVKQKG